MLSDKVMGFPLNLVFFHLNCFLDIKEVSSFEFSVPTRICCLSTGPNTTHSVSYGLKLPKSTSILRSRLPHIFYYRYAKLAEKSRTH